MKDGGCAVRCSWRATATGVARNFNALPTTGKCEGGWTWHVEEGSADDVRLDGLTFSVYANWPGAIHHGNGEALILIDDRADVAQRQTIERLLGGKVGGPWGVLAWTWPRVHGPHAASYELVFDGVNSRMKCGEYVEIEGGRSRIPSRTPSHIPVSSCRRHHLQARRLGATTRFRVTRGVERPSGKYWRSPC